MADTRELSNETNTPLLQDTPLSTLTPTPSTFKVDFSPTGKRSRCWWCCFFLSLFYLIILPIIVNYEIRAGILEQIVMDGPKAQGYEQFLNRSHQGGTMMLYTFFNITNPHEVLKGGKPHLEELGPFVYRMSQIRSDLEFDYNADTVAFRQLVGQKFDARETLKSTKGKFDSDQVKFTSINALFFGMKAIVGKESWHLINDITLWNNDFKRLFDMRTVHEMIEGYTVTLNLGGIEIPVPFPGINPSQTKKSNPYKYKNKIYIGKKNLTRVNGLIEWGPGTTHSRVFCPWGNNPFSADCKSFKNNPCCGVGLQVKPWKDTIIPGLWNADANLVQGTFGDAFRPFIKRGDDQKIIVWSDQLFRALQFHNRDGVIINLNGIELLRFTATSEFWQNSTVHPPNDRFYQYGPNGLVNASIIYEGAPIFVSLPHFLGCDPSLLEGVTGLNPDPDLHDMFIDVEPHTGMTFHEHNRIQISAKVNGKERYGPDVWFPQVKDVYVPIGYFDAYSEINHNGVKDFLVLYGGLSIFWGALSLGAVLFTVTMIGSPIYFWFKRHHRSRKSKRALLRQRSLDTVVTVENNESLGSLF